MHSFCLFQENVENGWRQDATLANSDSCLKPFKCVTIGHNPAGALVIYRPRWVQLH